MEFDNTIFKAYDIRGIYPDQLNEKVTYLIGREFARLVKKRRRKEKVGLVVGSDMRLSSPALKKAVIEGILNAGADVCDVGLVSTPTFYFAVGFHGFDGGIQVSASHNPKEYNGLKIVYEKALPVSKNTGLLEIKEAVLASPGDSQVVEKGELSVKNGVAEECVREQIKNIPFGKIKPLKIVIDPANSMGIPDMEALFAKLPCNLVKMNFNLDGSFPSHPADPMIEENIAPLKERVKEEGADLGIGIDGDGDRYFFVDEKGQSIPQAIMRGLMAQIELKDNPGSVIAYDIRPGKITLDMIKAAGGRPLLTPVGHSLIKNLMVKEGAIFGGESSGHFAYKFDYGTFEAPVIEVVKFLVYVSEQNKPVSEIIAPYDIYHHSGEINMKLEGPGEVREKIEKVKKRFADGKHSLMDGLSVEYPDFWFNLRPSNTEPFLRLAVEGKSRDIVERKVGEIRKIINTV